MSGPVEYDQLPEGVKSAIHVAENIFDPDSNNSEPIILVFGVNGTRLQRSAQKDDEGGMDKEAVSNLLRMLALNENITGLATIFEAHRLEVPPEVRDEIDKHGGGIESIANLLREHGIEYQIQEILSVHMDERGVGDWMAMAEIHRAGEGEPRSLGEWEYAHMTCEEMKNIPGPRPLSNRISILLGIRIDAGGSALNFGGGSRSPSHLKPRAGPTPEP